MTAAFTEDSAGWTVLRENGVLTLRNRESKASDSPSTIIEGNGTFRHCFEKVRGTSFIFDITGKEWVDEYMIGVIRALENQDPQSLRLGQAWVSDEFGNELTAWLEKTAPRSLTSIELWMNGITDTGAKRLCEAALKLAEANGRPIDLDLSLSYIQRGEKLLRWYDKTLLRLTIVSGWYEPDLAENEQLWRALLFAPAVNMHLTLDGCKANKWACSICPRTGGKSKFMQTTKDGTFGGTLSFHLLGREHRKKCFGLTVAQAVMEIPTPRGTYFVNSLTGAQGWCRCDALKTPPGPELTPDDDDERRLPSWLQEKLLTQSGGSSRSRRRRGRASSSQAADDENGPNNCPGGKPAVAAAKLNYQITHKDGGPELIDPDKERLLSIPRNDPDVPEWARGRAFRFCFRDFWEKTPLGQRTDLGRVEIIQHTSGKDFHGAPSVYFAVTLNDWGFPSGWQPRSWRILLADYAETLIEDRLTGHVVFRLLSKTSGENAPPLPDAQLSALETLSWYFGKEIEPDIRPATGREIMDAFRGTCEKRRLRFQAPGRAANEESGMTRDIFNFLKERMEFWWLENSRDTTDASRLTEAVPRSGSGTSLQKRIYLDPLSHQWELDTELELEWRRFLVEQRRVAIAHARPSAPRSPQPKPQPSPQPSQQQSPQPRQRPPQPPALQPPQRPLTPPPRAPADPPESQDLEYRLERTLEVAKCFGMILQGYRWGPPIDEGTVKRTRVRAFQLLADDETLRQAFDWAWRCRNNPLDGFSRTLHDVAPRERYFDIPVNDLYPAQANIATEFSGGRYSGFPILGTVKELQRHISPNQRHIHHFILNGIIFEDRIYILSSRRLFCCVAAIVTKRIKEVTVRVRIMPALVLKEGRSTIRQLEKTLVERSEQPPGTFETLQDVQIRNCWRDRELQEVVQDFGRSSRSKPNWWLFQPTFPRAPRPASEVLSGLKERAERD